MSRWKSCLLWGGASAIMLGYTSILVYCAVWNPAVVAQEPLAAQLQNDTVSRIAHEVTTSFREVKGIASGLASSLSFELTGKPDTWESLTSVQGELWGAVRGTKGLLNAVFQSTTNLSTSYVRGDDGVITEYSRTFQDSPTIDQYGVDAVGHRTHFISASAVPPFWSRTWYLVAESRNGTPAFSSSVGALTGTPFVTVSNTVSDLESLRGAVSVGVPVSGVQYLLDSLDTVGTVYLLVGGSLNLIASLPASNGPFVAATSSSDRRVAESASFLNASLLDYEDHVGTFKLDGSSFYYSIRKLTSEYNVTVVSLLPRDYYFGRLDRSRRVIIWVFVAALLLWFVFASIVGVTMYRMHMSERTHLVRAEREGNLHKEKQLMMARVSHELRTPMTAMIGLLEVLDGECVTAEQKTHIGLLQKTSFDMMQLLDGFLILAKADAGKSSVEERVFNLKKELEAALASVDPLTAPRGVILSLRYDVCLPEELLGDRRKIRQVVDNLLSNAAKFTDKGSIQVYVGKGRFVAPFTQFVDIRVQDTGCGIPECRFEDVFDEFVQADPDFVRPAFGGSGLGLSIVRSLCKLMGGNVAIEYSSPSGTCFHCWLKLTLVGSFRKAERVVKTIERTEPLASLHVLVAEDTRLLTKLIERLLKKEGAQVTLTYDGLEVVEAYKADPLEYSAILMDLQMPRMDGYEATRCIRELEAKGEVLGRIPIIALTAHAMDSDAEKCREVGMEDYLRKPLHRDIIVATLLRRCRSLDSPRTPSVNSIAEV